ncbi:hypothetical protein [Sphingomonas sanxanigenens]|nr:hypothetical protein [Sphingomonas sanxanigenens]
MITAFNLAGFLSAHAMWCVSDGEIFTPIFGYTTEAGERRMERLVTESLETAVAMGKDKLTLNEHDANDAVLLYDARIPLNDERFDAIIVEIRSYFSPGSEAVMAIPYRPKGSSDPFRVYKPKLVQWANCEDFDVNAAVQSFFEGVDGHEKGAAVWNEALDQSI